MTQFKEGDEVLVKAKFLCGSEDWYYDSSKQKMYYDKAVLTFDYEIEGYFAPCVKDLIPASALDVNKELLAENEQLREALAFYAEWGIDAPAVDAIIEEDRGDKARAALNIVLADLEKDHYL